MFKKIHHKEIDSTHKYALRELKNLQDGFFVITADYQTAGIGRRGSKWTAAPRSSILATFIFPIPKNCPAHNLAQLLALSNLDVLESFSFHPLFKWPNDLLLSGKKISGVMGEIQGNMAIVSCGININNNQETLLNIDQLTTSLFLESGELFDLEKLENLIIFNFFSYLSRFFKEGFSPFFFDFDSHLAFKGSQVLIEGHTGILKGIDPMGRLLIETDLGEKKFSNGTLKNLS
jgi:BirA family biotin operon repressor/biotin-[acetyl-CoA-carboxylase] ligase